MKLIKHLLSSILLVLLVSILFPQITSAQYAGNLGEITGSVLWGTTSTSLTNLSKVKFVGNATGFTYTTSLTNGGAAYNSGYSLPADTYTVTLIAYNPDGGTSNMSYASAAQTVTVGAAQIATANIDLSQTTGLVQGGLAVNGTNSSGYVQFCPPVPAPCPISNSSSIHLSASNGPIFTFGASGFKTPIVPGDYQVHVITTSGIDAGIVSETVTAGQIITDPALQFQLNLGRISGSVLWGAQSTSITNLSQVKFVGANTGFTLSKTLTSGGTFYDSGTALPADTYTLSLIVYNPDGSSSYSAETQTITVGSGQTITANFDLSQTTGLVQGDLTVNGVSSGGYVQFCPPAPTACPITNNSIHLSASNGPIFIFSTGGFKAPVLPGNYQAHIITSSGIDAGIVPVSVAVGQISNDSSLQFQLNLADVSGSVSWQGINTSFTNLSKIKFVGQNTGFTYTTSLINGGTAYNSGYSLPADAYTVTLLGYNPDGAASNMSYSSAALTVNAEAGQSVKADIDLSQTTGLVEGTLMINGANSGGYVQFCPPAPASCPKTNSSIYFSGTNGPIFTFGASGFYAPLLPGTYQAHVISLSGVDMGILPATVTTGQVLNLSYSNVPPTPTNTPTLDPTATPTPTSTPTPTPIPTFTISGQVYFDTNQNGFQELGENGYEGIVITLNNGVSTTTDQNGNYAFVGLQSGTYDETLSVPPGYVVTTINPVTVALSANTTQNFGITHTAPTTTINLSPSYSDGTYKDPTTITLSATAEAGFSVANTFYTLDGGTQQTYTAPFTVTGNGTHTVTYWSVDNTGLQEAENTKTFTISEAYDLTGNVYVDANQNGFQDSSEQGYGGVTVILNTGQTTLTDTSGNYSFTGVEAGAYTASVTLPTGFSGTTTNPVSVVLAANTTANFGLVPQAPTVTAISVTPEPIQVNTAVSTTTTFSEPISSPTDTAVWNWGDGTTSQGTVTEPNGATLGSVTGGHTYTTTGIYTISVTVTDQYGISTTQAYQYLSVYNPTAQGLFSAGQRFTSPAGAYTSNPTLTGTVRFGLSYKYQGTMPVGDRQFTMTFSQANFTFNATSVTSFVTANGVGTITGTGTVNGSGTYTYLVSGDGNANTIRVQIKDQSGTVLYDTQPGAASTAAPTTAVIGNVIVH